MKILHYINGLPSGGAEKLLTEILPLMKSKGHEVEILISNNWNGVEKYREILIESKIKIHNLNVSYYNPLQILSLIKLMKRERYNIIHAHLFPSQYWLALASFFKPRITGIVKTEHSVSNYRRKKIFFLIFEKLIYSRYTRIIAISDFVKAAMIDWLKIEKKISVINNGVNLDFSLNGSCSDPTDEKWIFKKDNYNILMVGRFNGKEKDQNSLIKALPFLSERYHVYFAGEGSLKEQCAQLAKKIVVEKRVHFLGLRSDIRELMEKADLNVLSTNFEGLSGVALESMASGRPFIGSDVHGVKDVVPDKRFLFPAQDPQSLADKITEVVENEQLRQEMIRLSLTHVKKFDIKEMVNDYLKVYQEIIFNNNQR